MRYGKVHGWKEYYETLIPTIRHTAWNLGYALAVHGSLHRDCDLIAVPWIETASSGEFLVQEITRELGGYFVSTVTIKPHGRRAWVIYPIAPHLVPPRRWNFKTKRPHPPPYIDLSIMPRVV